MLDVVVVRKGDMQGALNREHQSSLLGRNSLNCKHSTEILMLLIGKSGNSTMVKMESNENADHSTRHQGGSGF